MGLYECPIVKKEYLSKDQFRFDLACGPIAERCMPGQFVNVLCDSLLRRPLSICGADRQRGIFQIAVRVKGSGTAYLEKKQVGDALSVLGPLGNGFDLSKTVSLVAVGGGIGIFPLLFLLQEAKRRGIPATAVCGFRSRTESFCLDEMKRLADRSIFASDCGDMDCCGTALDALKSVSLHDATLFTCGPVPMMRGVSQIAAEKGVDCQASLEERMGCGTGVCLVCACKVRTSDGKDDEYKRCCKDGPVFSAKEVVWESI